jgi:hypothetical protein
VYVLLLDRLDRHVLAVVTAGAEADPDEERRKFDDALAAPFQPMSEQDVEQAELMAALGVGSRGFTR